MDEEAQGQSVAALGPRGSWRELTAAGRGRDTLPATLERAVRQEEANILASF